MNDKNKGDYIPLKKAALTYGYTRDHLGYLIRKGDLQGKKLGSFYFTKDSWMKNYLNKSKKARESKQRLEKAREKQQDEKQKQVLDKVPVMQKTKKKKINIVREFKQAFGPLRDDIIFLIKKARSTINKGIILLDNCLKRTSSLYLDIKRGLQDWKLEICYFSKVPKRSSFIKELIRKTAVILRKVNYSLDFFSPFEKEEDKIINLQVTGLFKRIQKAKVIFKKLFKQYSFSLKGATRNILWSLSCRKSRKKTYYNLQFKFSGGHKLVLKKMIAFVLILTGLAFSSGGSYFIMQNLNVPNLDLSYKLVASLDKASKPVYEIFHDIKLPNPGTREVFYTMRKRGDRVMDQYYATKNEVYNNALLSKKLQELKNKTYLTFKNLKEYLANLTSKIQINQPKFSKIRKILSAFSSINSQEAQIACNNKLIAFEDYVKEKRSQIGDSKNNFIKKFIATKQKVKTRLAKWQISNNLQLAKTDNVIFETKKKGVKGVRKGAHQQLAQFDISLSFITEPFKRFGEFLASRFNANERLKSLEDKIAKIENNQKQEEMLPPSKTREGLVVVPSEGDDEKTKERIKESFSDEVIVEPDETGRSGVIRPVFRKPTDQKYLYLMVPLENN